MGIDKCLSEFSEVVINSSCSIEGSPVFSMGDVVHVSALHVILLIDSWWQKRTMKRCNATIKVVTKQNAAFFSKSVFQMFHLEENVFKTFVRPQYFLTTFVYKRTSVGTFNF